MKKIAFILLISITLFIIETPFFFSFSPSYRIVLVKGESMEPTIPNGSIVLARVPQADGEIKIGQIVVFNAGRIDEEIIIHRIVEEKRCFVEGQCFVTKGDNNEDKDFIFITKKDILGIYFFHIPFLGYVFNFNRENIWFFPFLFVLLFLILLAIIARRKEGEKNRFLA